VLYATAVRMWWLKQRTKKVAQERRPAPATAAHP
jgi:hypothetical protein